LRHVHTGLPTKILTSPHPSRGAWHTDMKAGSSTSPTRRQHSTDFEDRRITTLYAKAG
ncbi:505_t:CDS:1, partial [Acaulospora colombiana]